MSSEPSVIAQPDSSGDSAVTIGRSLPLDAFHVEGPFESSPAEEGDESLDGDLLAEWDGAALGATSTPMPPRRVGERISIGRISIPTVLVSWVASVAVHAGAIAVGVYIVQRLAVELPHLTFARGDGASELGIQNLGTGVRPMTVAMVPPTDEPSALQAAPILDPATEDALVASADALFEKSEPPALADLRANDVTPLIGLAPADAAPRAPSHARVAGNGAAPRAIPVGNLSSAADAHEVGPVGAGGAPSDGGTPGIADGDLLAALAAPKYPLESRRRREEGEVLLELDLMPDGSVAGIKVLSDAGHSRLVQAAITAVRESHLPPLREGGVAVRASVRVPFRFFLRAKSGG